MRRCWGNKAKTTSTTVSYTMERRVPLKEQLDDLMRVKKEYQRKVFHKTQMAKMERDSTETERQIRELRKVYFCRIVDRL
ncbi:Clas16 [Clostera anastomosis granulovirus B]|uniref:Clas16 n=1 Tax=Clostera anastomosis granulovirus B TaxID=1986290 RepID=A0A0K0WS33_9BBAC|nr:Clas16 [Clostera anastomosis granulovirus B]AKS25359.1 Clas16 [Clostera anastomosis granulovirus B]